MQYPLSPNDPKSNSNGTADAKQNSTDSNQPPPEGQSSSTETHEKNSDVKFSYPEIRFYRSPNGMIFGVCQGLGESFGLKPVILRILTFLTFFYYGIGIGLYLALALSLPRKDQLDKALNRQILGVCGIISSKSNIEVGLIRLLALTLLFFTGGFAFLFYIVLYFAFESKKA